MYLIINIVATYFIFIFPLIGVYYFFIKKNYLLIFQMIFGLLVAKIIEFIIKTAFFVPRPYVINHKPTFVTITPIDSSFPSGHTMFAFTLATIIFFVNKKLGIVLFFIAGAVGLARVAANIHYPIDVVSGLVMGVTIGLICGKIIRYARYYYSSSRSKKTRKQ